MYKQCIYFKNLNAESALLTVHGRAWRTIRSDTSLLPLSPSVTVASPDCRAADSAEITVRPAHWFVSPTSQNVDDTDRTPFRLRQTRRRTRWTGRAVLRQTTGWSPATPQSTFRSSCASETATCETRRCVHGTKRWNTIRRCSVSEEKLKRVFVNVTHCFFWGGETSFSALSSPPSTQVRLAIRILYFHLSLYLTIFLFTLISFPITPILHFTSTYPFHDFPLLLFRQSF